ncbi:MAG TPA: VWA domain-containing protein [Gemmatimonadaceae bacterium]|nr:VWA domain-containing protein [Gemmatimonadaceae bacterium]
MRLQRYLRNRALRLSRRVATPVRRWRARSSASTLALHDVARRIELTLVAMYGTPVRIAPITTATDADVALPASLDARAGRDDAVARYRLLAMLQASRRARGGDALAPVDDPLARDLFLLAETAAAERDVLARTHTLGAVLGALHFAELAGRPAPFRLTPPERRVETLLRTLLASPVTQPPEEVPACDSAADSRAWAERTAQRIRGEPGGLAPYQPRNPLGLWGLAWSRRLAPPEVQLGGGGAGTSADSSAQSRATGERGTRQGNPDASGEGAISDSGDGGRSSAGPSDEGDAVAAGGTATGDASNAASDDAARADPFPRDARRVDDDRPPPDGIGYPEWDTYAQRFRPGGATVSSRAATVGDGAWADEVLREHAPLVRQVRERFAPLRSRRLRLRRQRAGDELDLEACVAALADRRVGIVPSDRLYRIVRPARHTLAILLLADTSGSTGTRLDDGRTVLDVERMTLLLAGEALATMGDPYAMLAFSGAGRHGVQVRTLKGFGEHDADIVRRRISALAPRDNTRLGAAVRHAAAVLRAQPAERRILLLLSDGKPNDVDLYQGTFAVEDSRRALLDARADGTYTFCLTVEQDEQDYLPRLFGETGYRILASPQQLPEALLGVVRGMVVS